MKLGNDFHLEQAEYNRRHLETVKALGEIGLSTKRTAAYLEDLMKNKTEVCSLVVNSPKAFSAEGFRFNSLYVSDAQVTDVCKIKVAIDGLVYTITLAAGENKVNIPDGAALTLSNTSGNPTSFILARYNVNKS